jgi:hypothetical protein
MRALELRAALAAPDRDAVPGTRGALEVVLEKQLA